VEGKGRRSRSLECISLVFGILSWLLPDIDFLTKALTSAVLVGILILLEVKPDLIRSSVSSLRYILIWGLSTGIAMAEWWITFSVYRRVPRSLNPGMFDYLDRFASIELVQQGIIMATMVGLPLALLGALMATEKPQSSIASAVFGESAILELRRSIVRVTLVATVLAGAVSFTLAAFLFQRTGVLPAPLFKYTVAFLVGPSFIVAVSIAGLALPGNLVVGAILGLVLWLLLCWLLYSPFFCVGYIMTKLRKAPKVQESA
jgi:hypothetical protein